MSAVIDVLFCNYWKRPFEIQFEIVLYRYCLPPLLSFNVPSVSLFPF
jgi:hypothetical protein